MKKIEDMTPDEIRERQQEELKEYTHKLFVHAENCKKTERKAYDKYMRLRKITDEAKRMLREHCERYNLNPPPVI